MNKRDFYKELMSEYQFDKDKILANAKKGRFAKRSPMPIYIGITAAAAAAVVGVGTFMFTSLGRDKGVDLLTGSNITALSNKERIEKAIEDLRKNENSGELHDVMVTFREPLSVAEAQNVITRRAEGSVPVKMLYFSDESRAVGAEAVGKAFESGEGMVTGAVVNCAGYLMEQLQNSSEVFMVEIVTSKDDLNVVAPINTKDPDIVDIPDIDIGGDTSVDKPSEPSESVPESSDNSDGSDNESGDNSGESSDSSGEEAPSAPDVIPDGVKLPTEIDGVYCLTDEIYAKEAFFVDDDSFFAIVNDGAAIYDFDGYSESLVAYQPCEDARVEWVAADGSEMLVSACEEGRRSKLFYVDTKNALFNELDVEGIVMSGEIADVVYNKNSGVIVLNIDEDGRYYACSAYLSDGEAEYIAVSYYCDDARVSVLCADENYVYLLLNREGGADVVKATVYGSADGVVIYSEDGKCDFSRSFAGTYAAVSFASGSYIVDAVSGTLIAAPSDGIADFGVSENLFFCGGGYYAIENGEIRAASGLDVIAKIDWKNSFSSKYKAALSGSRLRITASSYSERNEKLSIHFGSPYENASAEIREAVNNAIGLQNALSKSMVKASGIQNAEMLDKTIKAIYEENAANALKNRCNILQTGELSYEKGGLGVINVSETVLVIGADDGETAVGTLYIKVGGFNGVSGYRTAGVALTKTAGKWKMSGIIE